MAFYGRLFATLLLMIGCLGIHAQDVTYSRYDKFDYRSDAYAIVGMSGGYLYTYIKTEEMAKLDAYDDSMNKVATVLLDFFPQRIYQVKFVPYPTKMMAIYQALESNKVVQYVAMLDGNGLLKGKPMELRSTKTGILGATRNYYYSSVSENKKHILIYSVTDKKGEIEFDGIWLDDNGAVTKKSKARFKTENTPEHGEVNVANDGTVYMAAYTPTGAQDYADQYWVLSLPLGGTTFTAKELELGEHYATGGYTRIDNVNNKVYFGGFYSNSKNGRFSGLIYAAYDVATAGFTTNRFIPFDDKMIAEAGEKRKSAFDNYLVRQLIVKNDGGFVLVAEEQYVTTRSTFTPGFGYYSFYSPAMNSSVREYHYNDILAVAYDKDGVRSWNAYIPKQQYSQEDDGVFSSFALLNTGGAIAFLYNDFDMNHSRIQLSTLTPDGQTDTHSLSAEGNDYPDWLPKSAKQVSGRVLIVPCFHKRQICFAKVKF